MGLEMLEEFLSIKPIKQSIPQARIFTTLEKEVSSDLERRKDEHYCYHTPPTSPSKNSFDLVCPPPPKKRQRLAVTTRRTSTQSQERKFFQVPDDLTSIFLLRTKPSTVVTTTSHQLK